MHLRAWLVCLCSLVPAFASAQTARDQLIQRDSAFVARAPLLPFQQPLRPVKDPALAGILSFVLPGAGQVYAGRPGKGIFIFLGTGLLASRARVCLDRDANGLEGACEFPGFAYVALTIGTWLYGVFTAPGDAITYNYRSPR